MIGWIHEASDEGSGIIINPAGYSFTSIAMLDALKMFDGPIIELHITNIHRREEHYHHSDVSVLDPITEMQATTATLVTGLLQASER